MNTGLIADIQKSSIHDGPGIRTTVFFKGCPLHCIWCHNPECISFKKEVLLYREKCIHCGKCSEGCYAGARVECGREMSAEQLYSEIAADREYYRENGGVTFSGGEPMAQKEFLAQIIRCCQKGGIKTAIETSLIYYDEELLSKMQLIMFDIKLWDSMEHKKYTGAENGEIIRNILAADKIGIPMLARTPIIPGINDSTDNIKNIAGFLCTLKNVVGYELLAYHPLGESKRKALGMAENKFEIPSEQKMKELRKYADIC